LREPDAIAAEAANRKVVLRRRWTIWSWPYLRAYASDTHTSPGEPQDTNPGHDLPNWKPRDYGGIRELVMMTAAQDVLEITRRPMKSGFAAVVGVR